MHTIYLALPPHTPLSLIYTILIWVWGSAVPYYTTPIHYTSIGIVIFISIYTVILYLTSYIL